MVQMDENIMLQIQSKNFVLAATQGQKKYHTHIEEENRAP
jgi:hypothetical protein